MFLGAIVCTTASRYEDDHGLPALTDQANDHHQQTVYDVDHGVNASFACNVSYIYSMLKSKSPFDFNRRSWSTIFGAQAGSEHI